VIENNVVEFVLGKAKVIERQISFEELASQTPSPLLQTH
jgi:trigger factor